jgi:hypothetical protein
MANIVTSFEAVLPQDGIGPMGLFRQEQEKFRSSSGHIVQYDVMCRGERKMATLRNWLLGDVV